MVTPRRYTLRASQLGRIQKHHRDLPQIVGLTELIPGKVCSVDEAYACGAILVAGTVTQPEATRWLPVSARRNAAMFAKQLEKKKPVLLQDVFLTAVQRSDAPVTMFLVNGVMLQGEIAAFDLFCMLLERDGLSQLVYKHAISTVQPEHPINLAEVQHDEEPGA